MDRASPLLPLFMLTIKEFKKNRNEGKDRDDLQLIEYVLNNGDREDIRVRFLQYKRRAVAKIQGAILRIAHKTGTYDLLRKIYKTLRGRKHD